eukprot:gene49396-67079_t
MNAVDKNPAVTQYFNSIRAALAGLEIHWSNPAGRLSEDGPPTSLLLPYVERLRNSFACWENRIGFVGQFRISRAESGFPVFQNVLELENDGAGATKRLASIPAAGELRGEMVDFILRRARDIELVNVYPAGA